MFKADKLNLRTGIQISGIAFIVVLVVLTAFSVRQDSDNNEPYNGTMHNSPYIPDKISFCGEEVPIQYFDVYESLERELIVNMYFHSQTLLSLKKGSRYLPTIEPILRKNNIPDDYED